MLHRRALLAAPALLAGPARAQATWPDRPLRVIVGFPPGGSLDVLSRLLAEQLSQRTGQPVVVENRPGAAGNLGAEVVARAAPDGTTIGTIGFNVPLVAPFLYAKLPFDPARDFAWVSPVWEFPNVACVPAQYVPARSIAAFIAWAKERPGGISYGSPGVGSSPHLAGAYFMHLTGLRAEHVPFRGAAQTIPAMLSGDVQIAIDNLASYVPVIQEGRMRALAVTAAERWPTLPEVPTFAELGMPQMTMAGWSLWAFPAGTPAPIVDRLGAEIAAIAATPAVQNRALQMGARLLAGGPEAARARIATEMPRWQEIARISGARLD